MPRALHQEGMIEGIMKTKPSPFVFAGGIHPVYHKELSAGAPISALALPRVLTVPLSQHLGAPAKPVVKPGDIVKKNQLIGEPGGFISAPVHAPAAGKVTAITEAATAPGRTCAAIVIETDAQGEAETLPPIADWQRADKAALQNRIGEAGVVGMGGAGFPTKVKLSPPPNKPIDTLILNGAECEPYLTSDHRMMLEHAEGIRRGAEIIRHVLGAKTLRVAIEDNKPDAIAAMEQAFADIAGDVEIFVLKTSYPQGAEKQQIYSVTGREVPRGGLPMDVGCVVENVSTAYAAFDAVANGQPLTRRVVSVTGDALTSPSNLLVPNGTMYADLVAACGGLKGKAAKVISGGPMMGFAVNTLDVPTGKTTSGVVLLPATTAMVSGYTSQACISCRRCVEA
jgi:electron transport complex protein RnfC